MSLEREAGERWWERERARDLFWFAALAAVLATLLHESLFQGKGLTPADAALNWPPWNQTTRPSNIVLADQYRTFFPTQEFTHQQGNFPLWNPELCCGVPNLGAIQGALLFPIRLLLSPLDPFAASGPAAFLKLCLAGWFTLIYMRQLGVSREGAFLSGLVFSLSGFMVVWLGHPHVNSAMWLPLLLYCVEKTFRCGRGQALSGAAVRAWVVFAAAFACVILGGHPPTAIQVALVTGGYFLFRLMEHRDDAPGQRAGSLAVAIAVGLLLAAPQILPYLEYYLQSSSTQSSASLARWSLHLTPASLIRFLVPNVLGNPTRGFTDLPELLGWHEPDTYEPDNFNERNGYVGVVPLFLAACAIGLRRCRFSRFYACLGAGSLLVIFGAWPFAAIAHALPFLRDVNETRLLLVVGFSLAALAGLGWDELARRRERFPAMVVGAIFFAVVAAALVWFGIVTGGKLHSLDTAHREFLERQFEALAAGLGVVALLTLWRGERSGWIPTAICLGWSGVELFRVAAGYNPSIARERYYPRTPGIEWLQKDESIFRIFGGGMALAPDCAEVFGLSDARGCDYMTVRRYEELITGRAGDFFFYRNAKDFPKTFGMLDVKYILSAAALPLNPAVFDQVYSGEIFIYRFKLCRDRALVVFDWQMEPDPAAVLSRVSTAGFDPQKSLLLEAPPAAEPNPIDAGASPTNRTGTAQITFYQADDVRIDATLSAPGYLLLLDTYFPGWSAKVNGQQAPIYRADYNFRAVPLPAGKSTVEFSYFPASLRIGLILFAAGVVVLGGAWGLSAKLARPTG